MRDRERPPHFCGGTGGTILIITFAWKADRLGREHDPCVIKQQPNRNNGDNAGCVEEREGARCTDARAAALSPIIVMLSVRSLMRKCQR